MLDWVSAFDPKSITQSTVEELEVYLADSEMISAEPMRHITSHLARVEIWHVTTE